MKNEVKAIVFDIDGTVTPNSNSWLAMTKDLGASVEAHKAIFFQGFKDGVVSYDSVREQLVELWQATGNATRSKLESIFQSWSVFDEAKELIAFLQSRGLYIVFITGATSMYAKVVAEKFSVTEYFANGELVFDDSGNLVDFHFPLDESERKLEHLLAYCEQKGISPQNVIALGDSNNDAAIFKATQRGILVGMDKPEVLLKVAWKDVGTLSNVRALLEEYLEV